MLHYTHYTFVILHIFFYYACMSYAADLGSGAAVDGSGGKSECSKLKEQVYHEKNKCFDDFLSGKSKAESTCSDFSSVKKYFEAQFQKTAFCYTLPAHLQMINTSLHMRLDLIEKVMQNGNNVKEFFDNGGSECIKATKNPIYKDCIFKKTGINQTMLENSILRQRALFINKPTYSRGETILTCIEKTVNKTCKNPISSMNFIISIHKPVQEKYDALIGNTTNNSIPRKSNVTGIIIGCLVALIVVLLVTLFFIKKHGKRSGSRNRQSQSYNVSFQQNNAEGRTKANV